MCQFAFVADETIVFCLFRQPVLIGINFESLALIIMIVFVDVFVVDEFGVAQFSREHINILIY